MTTGMTTAEIITATPGEDALGAYLKAHRARLDPAALGFASRRRRTPGLRREEVAQRAGISATWYTWLEQGRGGAPSPAVLDRIATALMLTEVEREHLFLIGLKRPPDARYSATPGVSPRLERVLSALEPCPALVRTATWEVLAWNRAAAQMLIDYGEFPPHARNMLRFMFLDQRAREAPYDWESVARMVLASFRVEVARAGAGAAVQPLVDELIRQSPEFEAMWRQGVAAAPEGVEKTLRHPTLGLIRFEPSAFGVDGRRDLSLIVFNPVDPADLARMRAA